MKEKAELEKQIGAISKEKEEIEQSFQQNDYEKVSKEGAIKWAIELQNTLKKVEESLASKLSKKQSQ